MLNRELQSLALSYLLLLAGCAGSNSGSSVLYSSSLDTLDSILTEDGVEIDTETAYGPGASLRIHARGPRTVRLAEIRETVESGGELAFRGHVRTSNLSGQAYLELTVSIPGEGIRSSAAEPSWGSTDWVI